jgi:transposase-like protein
MKCERCTTDTHVRRHDVDGYVGYICERCREQWKRLRER